MPKSHTLTITLSCDEEQKDALSKIKQDITMYAVKQAIQSNLNIDKLMSNPGPDMSKPSLTEMAMYLMNALLQ